MRKRLNCLIDAVLAMEKQGGSASPSRLPLGINALALNCLVSRLLHFVLFSDLTLLKDSQTRDMAQQVK